MIVTIHQPEHFPYMGFFQKLSNADIYVILDNVKFRKNYFQNRNLIVNKHGHEEWLTIPVKKSSNSSLIKDVEICNDTNWRQKILQTINQNFDLDAGDVYNHDKLIDINIASINFAFDMLNFKKPNFILASSLNVSGSKSELLANITKVVGGTTYLSGPSGKDYLDESHFQGIDVEYFFPKIANMYSCLNHIKVQNDK